MALEQICPRCGEPDAYCECDDEHDDSYPEEHTEEERKRRKATDTFRVFGNLNNKKCRMCGEKHCARGLCKKHYNESYRLKNKDKYREYYKRYNKSYRLKNKDKFREYDKSYRLKNKDKIRKAKSFGNLIKEYHMLIMLERPTRIEMIRLECLADILGRPLDEWRNEWQRKDYNARMEFVERKGF